MGCAKGPIDRKVEPKGSSRGVSAWKADVTEGTREEGIDKKGGGATVNKARDGQAVCAVHSAPLDCCVVSQCALCFSRPTLRAD